jgi:hypothetical protein
MTTKLLCYGVVRREKYSKKVRFILILGCPISDHHESVQVSNWLPRAHFLPLQAPLVIHNFWE